MFKSIKSPCVSCFRKLNTRISVNEARQKTLSLIMSFSVHENGCFRVPSTFLPKCILYTFCNKKMEAVEPVSWHIKVRSAL